MVKYIRLPLLFLFLASLIGLFLRWQFISPMPSVNYTYFLHAHSHTMFLGWLFNALYIAYVLAFIPLPAHRTFKTIFILLQLLVVAMMISFPLQGYGLYSIIFSTLHTLLAIIFIFIFFRHTKSSNGIAIRYAKISLIFFMLSTAGPFSLGYLMANGLGQSQWYYFSIYYYLHFQYNGFFLFGVFSLFFQLLDRKAVNYDIKKAKQIGQWMAIACIPAYLLSILWVKPGLSINIVAGAAAMIQLYAFVLFLSLLRSARVRTRFSKQSSVYLFMVLAAFGLKLFLQFISSFPAVALLAYELRPVVIAYLHLALLGVISFFILIWYIEMGVVPQKTVGIALFLLLLGFVGTEVGLVLQPWWANVAIVLPLSSSQFIFLFSVFLSMGCLLFWQRSAVTKTDKNHIVY